MLSDARELAGDQQLDTDVYIVGPGAALAGIARELSGNGSSICLLRIRPDIRYSGWLFEGTQLDPRAHAQVVDGLGPFGDDPHRWPDPAPESRHLLRLSRRAHTHGCSSPTLPILALAQQLADDLEKQLAD